MQANLGFASCPDLCIGTMLRLCLHHNRAWHGLTWMGLGMARHGWGWQEPALTRPDMAETDMDLAWHWQTVNISMPRQDDFGQRPACSGSFSCTMIIASNISQCSTNILVAADANFDLRGLSIVQPTVSAIIRSKGNVSIMLCVAYCGRYTGILSAECMLCLSIGSWSCMLRLSSA